VSFLIDTNIISEVQKGVRCNENVASWFESIDDSELFLSVLVLGEIRKGIEKARLKQTDKANALENWLNAIITAFVGRILPVDLAVAQEWGRMNIAQTMPVIDGLLAATAKVNNLTIATRNIVDIRNSGVKFINPFEYHS
jgi:toxin FitB